jgi:hypothetical protein
VAVALLRMLLVERFTSLADLLDHRVGLVLLDESLHPGVVVSGDDHEAVALLHDLAVFVGSKLNGLEAGLTVTLAVETHRRGDSMKFAALFDPFVDAAEHFLVPGCSLCEVHGVLYHPAPVSNRLGGYNSKQHLLPHPRSAAGGTHELEGYSAVSSARRHWTGRRMPKRGFMWGNAEQ